MDYLEVVVLQLFMPSCCAPCEFLGFLPVCQVLVVRLDYEWFFSPDEVHSPVLDCFYDR
jgi:hypothetical protein